MNSNNIIQSFLQLQQIYRHRSHRHEQESCMSPEINPSGTGFIQVLIHLNIFIQSFYSCENITNIGVIYMSKNLAYLQELTYLELNISRYLLIEISLNCHFYSCSKITDKGIIDMSRNLTCLQKLTHLELNLKLYLLIEISLYS